MLETVEHGLTRDTSYCSVLFACFSEQESTWLCKPKAKRNSACFMHHGIYDYVGISRFSSTSRWLIGIDLSIYSSTGCFTGSLPELWLPIYIRDFVVPSCLRHVISHAIVIIVCIYSHTLSLTLELESANKVETGMVVGGGCYVRKFSSLYE